MSSLCSYPSFPLTILALILDTVALFFHYDVKNLYTRHPFPARMDTDPLKL